MPASRKSNSPIEHVAAKSPCPHTPQSTHTLGAGKTERRHTYYLPLPFFEHLGKHALLAVRSGAPGGRQWHERRLDDGFVLCRTFFRPLKHTLAYTHVQIILRVKAVEYGFRLYSEVSEFTCAYRVW